MSYIETTDITDNVVNKFTSQLAAYITESDSAVEDLAEVRGVRDTDDISTPVHFKIKRFAIAYVCMRLCQDFLGTNNVEIADIEKYRIKYDMYKKDCGELYNEITKEMITGNVNEIRDRATVSSGLMFRGS